MKRITGRWDLEFLESKRTAQNLVDNARRFKNEGWGNIARNEDRCSHNGQGRASKRKEFYEQSKRKMGSKVSRIPTSKLVETER